MKSFFKELDKLKDKISRSFIFLFLDYDGTLAPIADMPVKAHMPLKTRKIIDLLSKNYECKVAIISGRSLGNIKRYVGLKKVIYAGNHGLEIEGPKNRFAYRIPKEFMLAIKKIKEKIAKDFSDIEGILIEDKKLTLSVHYRLVENNNIQKVIDILNKLTKPFIANGTVKINSGKKVCEIKPDIRWHKGSAVLWLLEREKKLGKKRKILPIYIGDDLTDEDAFEVLKKTGVTVFVGKKSILSKAKFFVNDTKEVSKLLKIILKIKA